MSNSHDVAIFWDYENCPAPTNTSGYAVVNKITALAQPFGNIKVFKAYLEIPEQLPLSKFLTLRSELQSSGVSLIDCPHNGRKEVADKMLMVDMLAYAIDTRPPATLVLITGDRDFAYALSILKLRGYRIVLITLRSAHASLTTQATNLHDWQNDVVNPLLEESLELRRGTSALNHERNPATPPQLWRDLPDAASRPNDFNATDSNRHFRKSPRKPPFPSTPRGRSELGAPVRGSTPSPSKHRRNLYQNQEETTSTSAAVLENRPPIGHQASTQLFPDVLECDDTLSDMEFSSDSEGSPLVGQIGPLDDDIDGGDIDVFSRLTLSEKELPSKPSFSKQPHAETEPQVVLSSQGIGSIEGGLPAAGSSPLKKPTTAFNTNGSPSKKSNKPLTVPPNFALLVKVLQGHRAKGFFISYRTVVSGRISKGGTTYKNAGVNTYKQYLALAEKEGIIELGGTGEAGWVRLTPAWYDAVVKK